jgi:MYXO-CTERM domain-containing protein
MLASESIGNAEESLAVALIGLMLIARRRRAA